MRLCGKHMKKGPFFCIVKVTTQQLTKKRGLPMKNIISEITMKELEQTIYRALQKSFSEAMANILLEMDAAIAEARDKSRFKLKDKRPLSFDSMFGDVDLRRNYYLDRETGKYVYLLDQHLLFDGGKMMSPVVQDMAIELAATGSSYREASEVIEKLLGYPVISHEGIRQQLLNTEVVPKEKEKIDSKVIFVEVDGLYTKSQEPGRKGNELKISAIHQGWEMNGDRASLLHKNHFIHKGKLPFWEEFECFLMDSFEYDPTYHHLVINGDGANWITACREYFQRNAIFTIDRFHVYQDLRLILRDHPRYKNIKRKLDDYDVEGFLVELNSAVGTLEDEKKEEQLESLISQLSRYPEALEDYREKLKYCGIDTTNFRPMGSAEGTMSVFAKRLKNGRSWCKGGITKLTDVMIALMDGKTIKTLQGSFRNESNKQDTEQDKPPKHFVEKLTAKAVESTRDNVAYLQQSISKPVVAALKGLKGF